jgi:hypothetical protein
MQQMHLIQILMGQRWEGATNAHSNFFGQNAGNAAIM